MTGSGSSISPWCIGWIQTRIFLSRDHQRSKHLAFHLSKLWLKVNLSSGFDSSPIAVTLEKFRRPPSQNSQQHFLRLSFLKWEEARMKFGCQRTFWWLLCPLTSLRLSLSPSFLLLLSFSFVPRLSCPLFVFSPKQALIRQWWCRYILAEVMFAYLASLLHSLLCPSSSSLHLPLSLAALRH